MAIIEKLRRNGFSFLCSLLPKDKKKAFCQSFIGKGYCDNPKPIAAELLRRGWKVYWTVKGEAEAASLPEGIHPVKLGSREEIYHRATASVWVDNCRKWGHLFKRPSQYYIQTWHGFPLKRIEGDAVEALDPEYVATAKMDSSIADLFLSDSRFLTDIYRRAFWYDGDILECGFPRNDLLFGEHPELVEKVYRSLDIEAGTHLLLYAPTYRKDKGLSVYDVDHARCVEALEKRFGGKWLVLARLHPNVADKAGELKLDPQYVRNASGYPDIQELYLASSALLTDYSSSMFDFMNTEKPCFLYVNDVEAYAGDRNFTFDLDRLPFSRAETNEELTENILQYEETEQKAAVEEFRREFGMVENTGNAAQKAVDYMEQRRKRA